MLIIYDFEVYHSDWCVVLKPLGKDFRVFWNDGKSLRKFMEENSIHVFIGFNTKHYDKYIMQAACSDWTPEEIKDLNDYIIGGNDGWQYPKPLYFRFNNADIMDDMQIGQSLKSIEGHLGMNIKETEVDFNLDRKLTQEEMELIEDYCKADVSATEKIVELRMPYLNNKVFLGKQKNIPEPVALSMTNAKLTAAYLGAEKKQVFTDERDYEFPSNLRTEYIPPEVMKFFEDIHDKSIPDEEYFSRKLNITIGDAEITLGFGGIHGGLRNFFWKEGD